MATARALDWMGRLRYQGSSDVQALALMGISREKADQEMKTVRGGEVRGGWDAIADIASVLPLSFWAAPVMRWGPVRRIGQRCYRWISARRTCRLV